MPVFRKYDPIPAFTFHVTIEGRDIGYFTECEGLSFERDIIEHKEGGTNDMVYMLPGKAKRGAVTLKRGVDPDLELLDWYNAGAINGKMPRDNVSIIIYDRAHKEIARFDLDEAFPSEYVGPSLSSAMVAPAVQSLTIAHGGPPEGGEGAEGGEEEGEGEEEEGPVYIPDLAQSVYNLMKREAWLDRERFGRA
jgi:phage tail-like protein